tara:strand:+ start:13026 stop:18410 length:5385 start_codon:yes stop_codon:yes gene_type:complete
MEGITNNIEYGDIIDFIAPNDETLHLKEFFVNYIDENILQILNENGEKKQLIIENNDFKNENIDLIKIINRSELSGFALQNNLIPNTWIDIHFSGEIPFIITGEIVNLIEDQIEIKTTSSKIIFIDFGYRGIPLDLLITKINIRTKPIIQKTDEEKVSELEDDDILTEDIEADEAKNAYEINDKEDIDIQEEDDKEKYIEKILEEGDQISFGDVLGSVMYTVDLPESQKRYSLENQTKDILDELLSVIPNSNRTPTILNKIHILISRYEELRNEFSDFHSNNATIKKIITKPLVDVLSNMKTDLKWLMPVSKIRKKLYDIDEELDAEPDILRKTNAESRISQHDITSMVMDNTMPDSTNNYEYLQESLKEHYIPFANFDENYELLTVQKPIMSITNNDGNFITNVAGQSKEDKNTNIQIKKKYFMQQYLDKEQIGINSFLSLPYTYTEFSKINTKLTNIMHRSDLNINYINYWQLFRNDLNINTISVSSDYENKRKNIHVLQNYEPENKEISFNEYINKIVPSNDKIFEMIKEYIDGNISVHNIIKYFEPYCVYKQNVSNQEKQQFVDFIEEKIEKYKEKKNKIIELLKAGEIDNQSEISELYKFIEQDNDEILKLYNINESDSNVEIYLKIQKYDFGKIFNNILKQKMIILILGYDLLKDITKSDNKIIAKKYNTIDELENDNDMDIYFDAEYDNTYYDIINDFEEELDNREYDDKIIFIMEKIRELTAVKNIEKEAISIINKKRIVENGEFAILGDDYYIRNGKTWDFYGKIVDDNLPVLDTVDEKIKILNEKTKSELSIELDYFKQKYLLLKNIKEKEQYKNDILKLNIGTSVQQVTTTVSPHELVRDAILGQQDFVKRQNDILSFVKKFTRKPFTNENIWWYYCIETDTKLLPSFLYHLALSYISGKDYVDTLNIICKKQGTISDDESSWVDKYSGYNICPISFDTQEGYTEEGFKIKSRGLLQEEIIVEKQSTFENPYIEMISNVVNSVAIQIGIDIEHHIDFIIKNSYEQLEKDIPGIKKTVKNAAKQETDIHRQLIIISLIYFLIVIQTSIPRIKLKKKYPGCIASLKGYPYSKNEKDIKAVQYIACVANKTKSSIAPWNSLGKKFNENTIAELMLYNINVKKIRKLPLVKQLLTKRKDYEKTNPEKDDVIITNEIWTNFLPLLYETDIGVIEDLTDIFIDSFYENIRKGNFAQRNELLVLRSKIIYFSTKIQELIQKTVSKKYALLNGNNNKIFLENSCCNDGEYETYTYFSNREPDINLYNEQIHKISKELKKLNMLTTAPILYYPGNTKPLYNNIVGGYTKETIYRAFIYFCKLKKNLLENTGIRDLCVENINYTHEQDFNNIIEQLESTGINYNQENLHDLMNIVNDSNKVNVYYYPDNNSNIDILRVTINEIDSLNLNSIPSLFRLRFIELLDTFNIGSIITESEEIRNLKNYLTSVNNSMKTSILDFFKDNSVDSKCFEFINNIELFGNNDMEQNENIYPMQTFMKKSIRYVTKVFPYIILNNIDYTMFKPPDHWNISYGHSKDLHKIVNKYYEPFKLLYKDEKIIDIISEKMNDLKYIDILSNYTYFFASIENSEFDGKSIFDKRLTIMIFKFYFFLSIIGYIDTVNLDVTTQGIKTQRQITYSKSVGQMLESFIKVLINEKETVNYNYEQIRIKVNRSRTNEREEIKEQLKLKTDEERSVEKDFMKYKLEGWNKGLQKGLRIYEKDTYDQERLDMEDKKLRDIKLNKSTNEEDYNVYEVDDLDFMLENRNDQDIDNEVNDLSMLPEDDDYGLNDGDENY